MVKTLTIGIEIDFFKWVENRFIELLQGQTLENDKIIATTRDVTCKGEVSVNTRKQKTIFLYELDVSLKWEGELKSTTGTTYKGTVNVPYISEENDDDEFEVRVTADGNSKENETMRSEVRSIIIPILKQKIPQILQELRGAAREKTKLPPKMETTISKDPTSSPSPSIPSTVTTKHSPSTSKESKFESFTLTDKFLCRPEDLFECLIDSNHVKAYSGGDAIVSREVGGKFKLFGGSVEGENVEVEFPKKLVQKWRFNSWSEGHYSIVTITLEERDSKTILKLNQTGVPKEDRERTEKGWSANFWVRIKGIFGYGSFT